VTGLDLDAAMIARARANADGSQDDDERRPSFVVGDVASMAFPDGSFDLVVSTLSMHHWADPKAGLAEIGRVLRPNGRAFVWDFRAGPVPLHGHLPTRSNMCTALRSAWSTLLDGAGHGGCTSSDGSSLHAPSTCLSRLRSRASPGSPTWRVLMSCGLQPCGDRIEHQRPSFVPVMTCFASPRLLYRSSGLPPRRSKSLDR
jgi:SAM-dependent methyltransferase